MSVMPDLGAPSRTGGYTDPGSPTQNVAESKSRGELKSDFKSAVFAPVMKADQVRGAAIDFPLMVLATGILYDKAFIEGTDDASWGLGDALAIVLVSWFLKRAGVGRRWEGVV